jgi:Tol biopolymer transport system component
LSDPPDDAWLIALGTDVSDGKTVDWTLADRLATDAQAKALISNLKRLESVVHAHRSTGDELASQPPNAGRASAGHWHHLVLFESVGAGAFGTVHRAWDTRVDREVALKLVPARGSSARSPLGEARNLAKIRHPNIVTVYGAEQDAEQVGIWMEFIQGETLAEMIRNRGPMSAWEAVGIGVDLCRALSALQAAALLHRDIKAHNVMREAGGRIVLMDFSGAWTTEAGETPANLSGTPLYMAPELFDGRPASFASDIYSLGVLLFYVLSGRFPVSGASLSDIRAAHVRRDRTRLRDLRPELPEAVVQVVERASASDVHERYQTAGELEHALVGTLGSHAPPRPSGVASRAAGRRTAGWVTWTSAAVALLSLTALSLGGSLRPAPVDPLLVRFAVSLPENTASWPRVSPDGRLVVYGTGVEGQVVFWVRPLRATEGRALLDTSARESPFWSPDSRFLAFFDNGKLKKIAVDGESGPQTLADVPHSRGGDWGRDNTLLFSTPAGLMRVGADGSGLAALTTLDSSRGEYSHGWPEFLPDGRRFLFVVRSRQPDHSGVYVASLDQPHRRRRLMPDYSRTVYSPAGYVLFTREGALQAQRFDARTETLVGQPETLASGVKHHVASDGAFDVSDNGVLIYRDAEGLPMTRLTLHDRSGHAIAPVTSVGAFRHPRFSPDGHRIVAEAIEPGDLNANLWLFEYATHRSVRFTSGDAPDIAPTWSPDGRRIAFSSKRGSRYEVYTKEVDVVAPEAQLPGPDGDKIVEDWSPDGLSLVSTFVRNGLWVSLLKAPANPALVRPTSSVERWLAEFSPDGQWIAYTSFESNPPEVFVEPAVRSGARYQVSVRGGTEPHWREDGRELFYLTPDGQIASVEIAASGTEWRTGKVERLFRVAVPDSGRSSDYHVRADGKLFVVNTILGYRPVPPVQVVVSWTSLIAR